MADPSGGGGGGSLGATEPPSLLLHSNLQSIIPARKKVGVAAVRVVELLFINFCLDSLYIKADQGLVETFES